MIENLKTPTGVFFMERMIKIIRAQKNDVKKIEVEKKYYHNTLILLQKYRDVVWSIEASVLQTKINFEREFGCGIEEFLDMSYAAGADLSGTNVEEQMRCIEKNQKMLRIIDNSVDTMRRKHKKGELFYWILYYTYLSDQEAENIEEIIQKLMEHTKDMSFGTYYRRRNEAISSLSTVLWGFTAKDSLNIITQLLQE